MKIMLWIYFMQLAVQSEQAFDISEIRSLYQRAPEVKQDAITLNKLMFKVDSNAEAPVLVCYKGANEMIQAKYAFNPIVKLAKFNRGKVLITKALGRDTLNLEMRFIRYSIQSNLPAFLNYHNEIEKDKNFLMGNTRDSKDPELKKMILNYLELKN